MPICYLSNPKRRGADAGIDRAWRAGASSGPYAGRIAIVLIRGKEESLCTRDFQLSH
jgi:hypothetical protein